MPWYLIRMAFPRAPGPATRKSVLSPERQACGIVELPVTLPLALDAAITCGPQSITLAVVSVREKKAGYRLQCGLTFTRRVLQVTQAGLGNTIGFTEGSQLHQARGWLDIVPSRTRA